MDVTTSGNGLRNLVFLEALALAVVLLGWVSLKGPWAGFGLDRISAVGSGTSTPGGSEAGFLAPDSAARELDRLDVEARALRKTLAQSHPRGTFLVVDRRNNRIYLRKGEELILDAAVSTGSGTELRETGGEQRSWVFDTPTGRFSILNERTDPVWTKPDWAFLESGEPVPRSLSARREYGTLGEYALDLGDGYMIHGTLYERLLGRSVTHGCIRVGRDALRQIAARTGPGTPVFIF